MQDFNQDQNINIKQLSNRIQSRQSSRSEVVNGTNNFKKVSRDIQNNNYNNNLNNQSNEYFNNGFDNSNNNFFDYNIILTEIANFKKIIKNVLENQNEFQNKLIDNTRLISEQENIIRLNSIKLNEHDSKLTEILITFNNFMNFNEKTNMIIKELTNKYEDSVKKNDFNDLKMNLFTLNKTNEVKIAEASSKIGDINFNYEELKKEQGIFQKYTLEKLTNYQNENMESRIQQQQQLIKLEETRENKFNQQVEQIKIMIRNQDQNFITENSYRKSAMDNNKNELTLMINQSEEKLNLIQKSSLEMEKKILNFSKEYISIFRDLISQNNENYEIEIKSLKNILTNNIIKADKKAEESISKIANQLNNLSEIFDKNRNSIVNIENIIKDKVSYYEKSLKLLTENFEEFKKIQNNIRVEIETTNNDINKIINDRINLLNNTFVEKLKSFIVEVDNKCNFEKITYENLISDSREKIELFKNQFNSLISDVNTKIERKLKDIDLEDINFDLKLNEKFNIIKEDNDEYKKKLIILINKNIDEAKQNNVFNQKNLIDTISNKMEFKIQNIKMEIENIMKEDLIIREGNLHKGIIQTEDKLFKFIDSKIIPLQN